MVWIFDSDQRDFTAECAFEGESVCASMILNLCVWLHKGQELAQDSESVQAVLFITNQTSDENTQEVVSIKLNTSFQNLVLQKITGDTAFRESKQ